MANGRTTGFRKYDGTYVTNDFVVSKNQTYYFNQDGVMVTGWQTINNATYHFNDEGAMETSTWADGDNARYYLGENGAHLPAGRIWTDPPTILTPTGKMATGDIYLGLTRCSFDENGKLISKTESQIDPNKPAIALTFDDGPAPGPWSFWPSWRNTMPTPPFLCWGRKVSSYPECHP